MKTVGAEASISGAYMYIVYVPCNAPIYIYIYIHTYIHIQGVPGIKVTTSGFNSRSDFESKMSYIYIYIYIYIYTWLQFATVREL